MNVITQSCLLFIWVHTLNLLSAEEDGDVRLVGGTGHCNGILELKQHGEWRPVVRGPFWTGVSSNIMCRQLNCGTASSTEIQSVDRQNAWSISERCDGSESSLRDCGEIEHSTTSVKMMVICKDSVRLVDKHKALYSWSKASLCSGRLEVKSDQSWVSVCEDDFDQQDAEVVCRELGCGAPSVHQGVLYDEVKGPMWAKEFQCKGNESALMDCGTSSSTRNTCSTDRLRPKTLGLSCSESNDVRLVRGTSHCNGVLEMKYLGEWREVDDWSWNQKSSAIVCRQLGCGSVEATERFKLPTLEISIVWWIQSKCDGPESSLWECIKWRVNNDVTSTYSSELVRLHCSDLFKPNITASIIGVSEGQQQGLQVSEGSIFSIGCSIQPQYPGGSFHLTFTGPKTTHNHTQPAVNHSANFLFPAADHTHQGNYSCVYRISVFSRNFSSESEPLSLNVTSKLT